MKRLLILFLLVAAPVNAFTIKGGTEAQHDDILAAFLLLPRCEQIVVEKHLVNVILTKRLSYPRLGDSYGFGTTLIAVSLKGDLLKRTFLHECAHYFDWYSLHISKDNRFAVAVKDDFAAMTKKKADENDYLMDPKEAQAEFFSYHFLPHTYFDTRGPFDINLMNNSYAIFESELAAKCGSDE